jgi:transcriptional regulator with XRE-family HTH domain
MDSFGSRLRYERERRQIALKSIAESTKIGITLLEGLERDDVSRWPSGIFRKSFVRSYAVAIGLDPESIVREFVERHPDPLEVDIAAPSAGARSSLTSHSTTPHVTPSPSSAGPLAIKLTITWSGSVQNTIARLADWKIVRMLLDRGGAIRGFKFRKNLTIANLQSHNTLRIFQSANLPMLHAPNPHVSGGEAPDQAPPA